MAESARAAVNGAGLQARSLGCFRNDRALFSDLSFGVDPGQVLLVEGPNGCGKTSLLRILCGIRLQDGGEVLWRGEAVTRLGSEYHEILAYVGHHDGIKLGLTAWENLRMTRAMGRPSGASLEEVLGRLGLHRHAEVMAAGLSAGQRRRLALGRLLVTESRLWILDEPYTALDRAGTALFNRLVEDFVARRGAVIMTSHQDAELDVPDLQKLELGC